MERLKRLFVLGDISEQEYKQERDGLRARLRALKPPEMPDLEEAARLLEDIGLIWEEAMLKEEKQIVHTLLEAVYLDSEVGPVVSVKPKAEFRVLFELASDVSFVEGAVPPGGTTLEEVASEREREASTTAPNHPIGGFFGGGRAVICNAWWAMIQWALKASALFRAPRLWPRRK